MDICKQSNIQSMIVDQGILDSATFSPDSACAVAFSRAVSGSTRASGPIVRVGVPESRERIYPCRTQADLVN